MNNNEIISAPTSTHDSMRQSLKEYRMKQYRKENPDPSLGFKMMYGYLGNIQKEMEVKCYYMYNKPDAKYFFETFKYVKTELCEELIQYPV